MESVQVVAGFVVWTVIAGKEDDRILEHCSCHRRSAKLVALVSGCPGPEIPDCDDGEDHNHQSDSALPFRLLSLH